MGLDLQIFLEAQKMETREERRKAAGHKGEICLCVSVHQYLMSILSVGTAPLYISKHPLTFYMVG